MQPPRPSSEGLSILLLSGYSVFSRLFSWTFRQVEEIEKSSFAPISSGSKGADSAKAGICGGVYKAFVIRLLHLLLETGVLKSACPSQHKYLDSQSSGKLSKSKFDACPGKRGRTIDFFVHVLFAWRLGTIFFKK